MKFIKKSLSLLKETGSSFMQDRCVKLSAALSYYTVFSIGPLLLLIISLSGLFYGTQAIEGNLHTQISDMVGEQASTQIEEIIKNIKVTDSGIIGTIVGFVILIIGATGIFTEIQDSINFIWSIRPKPKRGLLKLVKNRMISFFLIISLGFLLLVSLLANAILQLLSTKLTKLLPDTTVIVFSVINQAVILVFISALFAVIFKVLPDGKIRWKDAFIGAIFTAILFMLGKAGIGYYLGNANLGLTYGAAASIVILLSWVYYTSIILYFGAEFTKVYAHKFGGGITPNSNAVFIVKTEAREIDKDPEAARIKREE